MKILLVVFICISILFSGCKGDSVVESSNPATDNMTTSNESVSSESIDESKTSWVETEMIGDTKITHEYRDGENDYTVTSEKFYDNGTVSFKLIRVFKNDAQTSSEEYTYREDGTVSDYVKTTYTKSGEVDCTESYREYDGYAVLDNTKMYPDGKNYDGIVEYLSLDGKVLAKGTRTIDNINGHECSVTKLEVYDADNNIDHLETHAAYTSGSPYMYVELFDSENNKLYSRETTEKSKTVCIFGENECTIVTSGKVSVYTDRNGDFIAELDDSVIVEIGEKYSVDNIVSIIEGYISIREQREAMLFLP